MGEGDDDESGATVVDGDERVARGEEAGQVVDGSSPGCVGEGMARGPIMTRDGRSMVL